MTDKQPETPDELLTDEEIRNNFRSNGEESYLRYCAELGIDLQDGINLARFGANRQLAKCHQSEAAIRADERKNLSLWLENETRGVNFGAWAYWWTSVKDKLKSGQSPKEG